MTNDETTSQTEPDRTYEDRERQRKMEVRRKIWEGICPPLYSKTRPDHPGIPQDVLQKVMAWEFDPETGKGIGILGPSGRGKTRMIYLLLKHLCIEREWRVFAVRSVAFGRACANAFSQDEKTRNDALKLLKSCRDADVLFLDDIGKERYTDRVEMEFYDLIEERTADLLPTFWTSNATSDADLHARMSQDRGEPIIRRLAEFSEIHTIK